MWFAEMAETSQRRAAQQSEQSARRRGEREKEVRSAPYGQSSLRTWWVDSLFCNLKKGEDRVGGVRLAHGASRKLWEEPGENATQSSYLIKNYHFTKNKCCYLIFLVFYLCLQRSFLQSKSRWRRASTSSSSKPNNKLNSKWESATKTQSVVCQFSIRSICIILERKQWRQNR